MMININFVTLMCCRISTKVFLRLSWKELDEDRQVSDLSLSIVYIYYKKSSLTNA